MKELLAGKNWKMFYSCHCNGTYKEYWRNQKYPDYQIITRPRKQTFSILSKNHVIVSPDWSYRMAEKMRDNGIAD